MKTRPNEKRPDTYTIGETGPDWEPITSDIKYYAQNDRTQEYAFGEDEQDALSNLKTRERW